MVKETTYLLEVQVSSLARSLDCFPQPEDDSFTVLASSQKQQMHIQAKRDYKTEANKKVGTVSHLGNYSSQCSARRWSDTSLCPAERKILYERFPLGAPFCSTPAGFMLPPSSLLRSTVTFDTEERALRWQLCYRIYKIKCSKARDILVMTVLKN